MSSSGYVGLSEADIYELATSGQLTVAKLYEAVASRGGEYYEGIPYSTGMAWIYRNQHAFLGVLRAENTNATEFFRELWGDWYADRVLSCHAIIGSLLPWRRVAFVRDICLMGQMPDRADWVYQAMRAGVTKQQIGEIIIERLLCDPDTRNGYRSFANGTFPNGYGEPSGWWNGDYGSGMCYWSVLDNEQFRRAVRIVVKRYSHLMFSKRFNSDESFVSMLNVRLYDEEIDELRNNAADKLKSVSGCNVDELMKLDDGRLVKLVDRLNGGSAELTVRVALRDPDGTTFGTRLLRYLPNLGNERSLADEYQRLYPHLLAGGFTDVAGLADRMLRNMLHGMGQSVGTFQSGMHRGRPQLQIVIDGVRYIESRYWLGSGVRYFPKEGDTVVFSPNGHRLTPKVIAVSSFTLVHRPTPRKR